MSIIDFYSKPIFASAHSIMTAGFMMNENINLKTDLVWMLINIVSKNGNL
jgi:hypothetical protein